jgi:uncharacterized protein (DUF1501 family)
VTIAPAIGYDHPNQSHFTSRHFWEVGELSTTSATGWMGRYLDLHGSRAASGFVGEYPGLGTLDAQGNLRNTSDFRDLYRGLLEQWLGADSAAIIPGTPGTVPTLVR